MPSYIHIFYYLFFLQDVFNFAEYSRRDSPQSAFASLCFHFLSVNNRRPTFLNFKFYTCDASQLEFWTQVKAQLQINVRSGPHYYSPNPTKYCMVYLTTKTALQYAHNYKLFKIENQVPNINFHMFHILLIITPWDSGNISN